MINVKSKYVERGFPIIAQLGPGFQTHQKRERAFLFQPSTFNLYNYDDDVQNHHDACDDADGDAEHPNDEL